LSENLLSDHNISLDTFFLSVVMFTLTKFIYSKKVLITKLIKMGIFNREHSLIKTIVAKDINTKDTVEDYLSQVENLINNIEHCNPAIFDEIKEEFNLDLSHFQYHYQKYRYQRGDEKCGYDFDIPESDFTVLINEVNESEIKIKIFYNSNFYSEKTVQIFYNSLLIILKEFLNENKLLKDIGVGLRIDGIIKNEIDKFIEPEQFLLNELFENVVTQNRDKIALISSDRSLTFDELNREANKISNTLLKKGFNIEDRVIIQFERGVNLIVAIFGVMKAGGTFIIVSPDDPIQRVELIKKDTKAKYIIDVGNIDNYKTGSDENPKIDLKPEHLFYISYTSGSTGKPKGVMVTHKSVAYTLEIPEYNMISKNDRYLLMTQPIFVVFIKDLFIFLLNEISIVIANDTQLNNPFELKKLHEKTKFNITNTIPSYLNTIIDDENDLNIMKDMKIIILVGEKLNKIFLNKLKKTTDAVLFNVYGTAEVCGHTFINNISNTNDFSIGKPTLNIIGNIMDVDGNPLPNGITGELWMGGYGVTKGYWNNKKLTEAKYTIVDGIHFFKTGDLALVDEENNYRLIDRKDNQIKLRGQRIDLGEIENNVPEDFGIEKAIATVNNENDDQILVLYFTTKSKDLKNDEIIKIKKEIRNHLLNKLPGFMIPQDYIYLDEFPKTRTGKISVKNLERYDDNIKEIVKPSTVLEHEIFDLCVDILGYDNFGVTNSLDSIGFTSLSIIRLLNKILDKYQQIDLQVNDLNYINIKDLSKLIEKGRLVSYSKAELKNFYPLTYIQSDYYDFVKQDFNSTYYLINNVLNIKECDVFNLKDALIKTIELNPYIKTSMCTDNGIVYQKRNDDYEFDIQVFNKKLTKKIEHNFIKPVNIFEPPLCRFELYYHDNEVNLLMSFHHIICDLFSIEIFVKDLIKIFNDGKENKVVSKKFDFFDFATNQFNISPALKEKSKEYFINQSNNFPLDFYKNYKVTDSGATGTNVLKFKLARLNIDVNDFLKEYNISENDLFLSLIAISLTKFLDINAILINFVFHGRDDSKFFNCFGFFAKTILLLFNVDMDISVKDFVFNLKNLKELDIYHSNNFNHEVLFKDYFNSKKKLYIQFNYLLNNVFPHNYNDNINRKISTNFSIRNLPVDKIVENNSLFFNLIKISDFEFELNLGYLNAYYCDDEIDILIENIGFLLKLVLDNPLIKVGDLLKNLTVSKTQFQV
ncbi:MAG: AMP-binding protein, partial [Methanobrevibacter sp.]|nr:AMP-binding protein [Candidatus Methanovirga procula]